MFIYNVTTQITHAIHTDWVMWMKEKHIPEVMKTGCFTDYRFVRLIDVDESEGITYAVQYHAVNRDAYEKYIELFAPALRKDMMDQWGNQFISFRSLMELVN